MTRKLLGMAVLCLLLVLHGQTVADQGERTANSETVIAGQLRGTWVAVSMERGGRKEEAPKERELTFTFEGDKVTITEGKHTEQWPYQQRDTKTPWEIDFVPSMDHKGEPTYKGIYRIDGDTLKIAVARRGARPTGYDHTDDDSAVFLFKRKK
jgi:uncharacterized protein (TIGR03067 family)